TRSFTSSSSWRCSSNLPPSRSWCSPRDERLRCARSPQRTPPTRGAAMATQEEYRAKARGALEKLQQQIDELRVQAHLAGAEARERFERAIDALRKRQAELKVSLDRAAEKSGDAWKSAAKQLEDGFDGIGDAFSSLADEIDANLQAAGKAAKAGHKALLKEWKKQREKQKEAREKLIDSA